MDTREKSYGFTAADLSFAALASPLIRPPELANFAVPDKELPPRLLEFADEMRATVAGQHVLKIYAKHRLTDGESVVTVKGVNRDRIPWPELSVLLGFVAVVAATLYTWWLAEL